MSALLRRRRRAAAVLAALLALALAADAVLKAERPGVAHEAAALAADGWDARGLLAFGEGEGAAGDANDAYAVEPLPEGFAEEVMPLDGYADVRVTRSRRVRSRRCEERCANAVGRRCPRAAMRAARS